ncbi:HNH endonuclease [Tessaracoccus sp. HDW20]|uniref:HNH endonuclease signature motif containing protein n=1 Tax=Tessaracoccus coleopterorum TaxID=2714950 RepID=UPI0038CD7E4D|nr:HNH endonuclease [Tessaracoccus coleopterorum]
MRLALTIRDRGCAFPGCDAADHECEAHHVIPWWDGGPTCLGNLVLLCPKHHKLVEPPRMHHPPGRPPDGTRTSGRDSARERWHVRIDVHGMPEFLPRHGSTRHAPRSRPRHPALTV